MPPLVISRENITIGGKIIETVKSSSIRDIIQPITSEPIIDIDDDYKYISFPYTTGTNNTSYSITFPENTECDILVVGGGGAGGDGGGGAGQLIYIQNQQFNGQYTINVGKGGTAVGQFRQGGNGKNSSITNNNTGVSTLSYGGGGGGGLNDGKFPIYNGNVGSGGGSVFDTSGSFPSSTYTNYLNGFSGSKSFQSGFGSPGGGGGAGEVAPVPYDSGIAINSNRNIMIADGGDGLSIPITGTSIYYAGGGGGGINTGSVTSTFIPTGGLGGGGNGTNVEAGRGTEGVPGTGGGGGGCEASGTLGGRNGGSGIVIIKYKATKDFDAQWTYNSTNPSVYHLGNVGIGTTNPMTALEVIGSVVVNGGITSTTIVANAKNFKIAHPLGLNKSLYHGCVESSRFDNIYRGKKKVINGTCEVDIDKECNTTGGMTTGTFMALNSNFSLYVRNNKTYDRVYGIINGSIITIKCEKLTEDIEIDWLVIGERKDKYVINVPMTTNIGSLICEHDVN